MNGYETSDARVSPLVWAVVFLAVLIVLSVAAMGVMFGVLYDAREEEITTVGPMVVLDAKPEGPILQVDPPKELIEMRERNEIETSSYGWIKRESGVVRIPIEEAMRLVVERGIQ